MHRACVDNAERVKLDPLPTALRREEQRQSDVMTKLFRLVAFSAKNKLSFRMYEELIVLLHESGVDVGDIDHSRITATSMNEVIADFGRDQLEAFLTKVNDIFGQKPHVGVAADKLTDLGGKQAQMVMFRVNFCGTPITIFAVLQFLSLDYDEDHEANGLSCFNKLCDAVEDFGVPLFEVLERNEDGTPKKFGEALFVKKGKAHSEQWRSSSFDGEACFNGNGAEKSVKARIRGDHGLGDKTHEIFHDMAHAADLLVQDAHDEHPYMQETVHSVIKEVYTYFSQSPHKRRRLQALIESWGADNIFRKLHHLFEVRFVASEYIAVYNFLVDLPAIVATLVNDLDEVGVKPATRTKVNGWLRKMKQFKFVMMLIIMCDIHTVSKIFSKNAQSDEKTIVDVPTFRAEALAGYKKLLVALGPEASRRLPSLQEGKLVMAEADSSDGAKKALVVTEDDDDAEEDDQVPRKQGFLISRVFR
jgi:hypothetical protein